MPIRLFFFPLRRLRGCLIALGGTSYRLVHIHRNPPRGPRSGTRRTSGVLPCKNGHTQCWTVFRHGARSYLYLWHPWLKHADNGVIVTYAEIRRFGRVSSSDGWLRVPQDFPDIPSAQNASRVKIVHKRQRSRKTSLSNLSVLGGDEPMLVEELNMTFPSQTKIGSEVIKGE